jgi:glycosyltransferase involved in cell wall biosynthesis
MASRSPMVSIVIPAYNLGRYLGEAIESVLSQEYQNIELIVLDDGSTDSTRSVLDKYAGRIYAETQQNMGQAKTLNKGWCMSRGDILGYVSADDALLPGAVDKAVARFAAHPDAVLTYCDYLMVDADSRPIRRVTAPEFDYDKMLVDVVCHPGPGAFFRRSAFEAVGLWNESLKTNLDYEYWLRLGLTGRFIRIPEVLALYRVHELSQTVAGFDAAKAQEPILVVSRAFDMPGLPPRLLKRRSEALSNANLLSAVLNFRAGRYRAGFLRFGEALSLYPRNLFKRRNHKALFNLLRTTAVLALRRRRTKYPK